MWERETYRGYTQARRGLQKKNHKQHENLIMLTLIVRKLAQLNSTHSHINKDFFYKKNERKRKKKKAYHASRVTH